MAAGAALWACGATGAGEAWAQVAGVRVNGVDVSAGSGEGWSRAGDDVILQRNGMTYVVDGASSDGSVRIVIMGNCTMVASNLVLSGGTPVSVYNGYSPVLELAGTLVLSIRFIPYFGCIGKGIAYAAFHSISAFCNAGFDLMGVIEPYSSFTAFSGDWLVNLTLIVLIIIGGLGFIVWDDLLKNGVNPARAGR